MYKIVCPLINFRIPWYPPLYKRTINVGEREKLIANQKEIAVKGVELTDGVKIKPMSKQDHEIITSHPFFAATQLSELISPQTYALTTQMESVNGEFNFHKVMRDVILSFRLLKSGRVFGSYVFCILLSKPPQVTSRSYEEDYPRADSNTYFLNFEDLSSLKEIYEKVRSVDFTKRRTLDLACRRFQRTYEERDAEDQLIDLMIASEALFLKGDKGISAKRKTIAAAYADLLGESEEEKEYIEKTLNEAYSIRNCIVHGSEYRNRGSDSEKNYVELLIDLVPEIEDYLRASIRIGLGCMHA